MPGNMTFDTLKAAVESGEIDTVLVAAIDMQGRLMGKRFHAHFFIDGGCEETHCCNYLLAVDMEMTTVQGYKSSNWADGLRRLCDEARPRHAAPAALAAGHRNGAVRPSGSPHPRRGPPFAARRS